MPITSNQALIYQITSLSIDMTQTSCSVTVGGFLGGQMITSLGVQIPTADFEAIITALPTSGLTRQADINLAIEQYVVSKGLIPGVAS